MQPCTQRGFIHSEFRIRRHAEARDPQELLKETSIAAAPTPGLELKSIQAEQQQPTAVALSRTPKFAPWLEQLELKLLEVGLEIAHSTTGARLESGAEDLDSGDEAIEAVREERMRLQEQLGSASAVESHQMEELRRLGGSLGKLVELLHRDLLPRMPTDPEALFLAAAADFIARKYDSSLQRMRTSLMATAPGHCTPRELAARHYFVAIIAIRIVQGRMTPVREGTAMRADDVASVEQLDELLGVIERGLTESLRLDPRLHSAYVDAEMLAQLRFPEDAHARVAMHARLVEDACRTGKYWVNKVQRPMHFYPKLRSSPWWEPFEFPWALNLMANYADIRAEVLRTRGGDSFDGTGAPPDGDGRRKSAERWDAVGSRHDAGDRELVEDGDWTELVLLNRDEKVAAMVARNRRLCPITLRSLDAIPAAADMARRGVGESTFSALGAGAHLKPHCGSTNCRLTCHLPLLVPDGCSIRVGDEERPYREGEMMIFDDSFEHEVWHRGKPGTTRVVLLIRFWHPDIPPERYPDAYHHMKRLYLRHRRRLSLPPLRRPKR